MKQSLNQDTLAYQIGMRPALQHRDMSALPLQPAVKAITSLIGLSNIYDVAPGGSDIEKACGNPEKDAIIFYMMNHAVSLIRQKVHVYEPLGKYLPIMELYHAELAVRSTRMFAYMLLICTRESRHDKQDKSSSGYTLLKNLYGSEVTSFHSSLAGLSSMGAAERLQSNPPKTTLGKYTNFLVDVFNKGKYNGGYGGVAWGKVAEVLRDFVHGKITAEMMMDTAFTLCHNNGPIFNKGMLFDSYSHEIYKILDVQRSGQVPQLVADKQTPLANDSKILSLWTKCFDTLGAEFSGYVDWFLVEELGALKQYPDQKTKQIAKHGYPSKFKAKKEAQEAKAELAAKAKLAELKANIEIIPGQFIKKVARSI